MPSNDPILAVVDDGGDEPVLGSSFALWVVTLGDVDETVPERVAAGRHRTRVLEAFAAEGLLGILRPNLTNEWLGQVSGTVAIDRDHRALVASEGGPVPGPTLRVLTHRLATRLRASVASYVQGMSEPWVVEPLGPGPVAEHAARFDRGEAVAASRVLVSAAGAKPARAMREALARRGIAEASWRRRDGSRSATTASSTSRSSSPRGRCSRSRWTTTASTSRSIGVPGCCGPNPCGR